MNRLADLLEAEWRSVDGVCRALSVEQWALPTDCPGWDVRDQVAHLVGIEAFLTGRPLPEPGPAADAPHVRNDLGRLNESMVDARRYRAGIEVLDELASIMPERLTALRSLDDSGWEADSWMPTGRTGTVRELIGVRLFDWWSHEQDIRRAVGRPGHLEGRIAELARDQLVSSLGYVVGKRAAAQDGTVVVFDITGPSARRVAVTMSGGRGSVTDEIPPEPTATISMPFETFMTLGLGRRSPDEAMGSILMEGDEELGRRLVALLNVTP